MEQASSSKSYKSSSTQTEFTSNKVKVLDLIEQSKHWIFYGSTGLNNSILSWKSNKSVQRRFHRRSVPKRTQSYHRLCNYTKMGRLERSKPPLLSNQKRFFGNAKTLSSLWQLHSYPISLKRLVLDKIHHKHPGQVGMLALANLYGGHTYIRKMYPKQNHADSE